MKKILSILFVFVVLSAKAQDFSNPYEYLNFINEKEYQIAEAIWNYTSANAHAKKEKKVQKSKDKLIEEIRDVKKEVMKLPKLDDSYELRDAMVEYLDDMVFMLTTDYVKVEQLLKRAEDSYESMNEYLKELDKFDEKLSEKEKKFQEIYTETAKKHNIQIVSSSSKLQANMNIAKIVNDYYNKIFLMYFHIGIFEQFAIKAVNNQDTVELNRMLDSVKSIISTSENELQKLKAYNGDNSLKQSFRTSLLYYKRNVKNFETIQEFFRVREKVFAEKERVDKLQKTGELTEEDVTAYNQLASEYNELVVKQQKAIENINENVRMNSEQWDKASTSFLDRHIPK